MTMLRLGIIGAGAIAAEHVAAFGRLGCDVRIVMTPQAASAATFAHRHAIARSTGDLSEVVGASDIDAVVVASPNDLHAEQTLAALKARKHVLCEIPLATSFAETERIAETAHAMGRLCMVCHTQRFWAPVEHLRRLVAHGVIQPLHIGLVRAMHRRENIGWTGRKRSWVDDILWHHGAHAIDTATCLLGERITDVVGHAGPRIRRLANRWTSHSPLQPQAGASARFCSPIIRTFPSMKSCWWRPRTVFDSRRAGCRPRMGRCCCKERTLKCRNSLWMLRMGGSSKESHVARRSIQVRNGCCLSTLRCRWPLHF